MDNKAYFMIVHERSKSNGTLNSGDFLPSEKEIDNHRKKVEDEKRRQDELFEKQKTANKK
jgi:hypothetical protein